MQVASCNHHYTVGDVTSFKYVVVVGINDIIDPQSRAERRMTAIQEGDVGDDDADDDDDDDEEDEDKDDAKSILSVGATSHPTQPIVRPLPNTS